jgi:hypothetical protein
MVSTDLWDANVDTDCAYYDTPSGNLWCPGDEPGQRGQASRNEHAAPHSHRRARVA